jgi:glycerate dehydrogenase
MNIVVLDYEIVNPNNRFGWEGLERLGHCARYESTPESKVIERCRDADAVITNKVKLTRAIIEGLPKLKYIGVPGTGTDAIDLRAAAERNITVTNSPDYGSKTVAQASMALLLALANRVSEQAQAGRADIRYWANKPAEYWARPTIELAGMTMGIVGLGKIGQEFAKRAAAFDMVLVAHARSPKAMPFPIRYAGLDELFAQSDFISLHTPLTDETREIVDARRIGLMKQSAFLINTARGGLINERDLADALNGERIAGAALDVLTSEPPEPGNPLLNARNVIITPHIAWATEAACRRQHENYINNLTAFLAGRPQNVVCG